MCTRATLTILCSDSHHLPPPVHHLDVQRQDRILPRTHLQPGRQPALAQVTPPRCLGRHLQHDPRVAAAQEAVRVCQRSPGDAHRPDDGKVLRLGGGRQGRHQLVLRPRVSHLGKEDRVHLWQCPYLLGVQVPGDDGRQGQQALLVWGGLFEGGCIEVSECKSRGPSVRLWWSSGLPEHKGAQRS